VGSALWGRGHDAGPTGNLGGWKAAKSSQWFLALFYWVEPMKRFLVFLLLLALFLCSCSCAHPKVYFDDTIREQIKNAIENSNEKIDIAMYCLSDQEIITALRKVKGKVDVRIIIDPKYHRLIKNQGFIEDKELRLRSGRKSGGDMHNKFCIFDGRRVMTGSYNISTKAHNKNYENAIFLSHSAVIREYQGRFDVLWNSLDTPH